MVAFLKNVNMIIEKNYTQIMVQQNSTSDMEVTWDDDLFESIITGQSHSEITQPTIQTPRMDHSKLSDRASIDYVGYIFVPLLLVLGLTGNTLTIIVMRGSKAFCAMSVSRILIALAISDSVLISLLPFNKLFVQQLLNTDIRAQSDAGCKIFFWAFRTAKMTSSWLVVLISIERFIAIWFPLRAKEINTTRKALIGVALVYIVIGTYNGVWGSFSDHLVNGVCRPNSRLDGRAQITGGFLVIGLTIYCFLPATLLCIINFLIIAKIVQSSKKAASMHCSQSKELVRRKPTIMLIGIAVAFVILVTPIASAHLVSYAKKKNIFESNETWVKFLREVSQLMEQLNYSINFVLYVLLGEMFRSRLMEMFGCKKSVIPKSTTTTRNATSSISSYSRNALFSNSSTRSFFPLSHINGIKRDNTNKTENQCLNGKIINKEEREKELEDTPFLD